MKTAVVLLSALGLAIAQNPDGAAVNPPWSAGEVIKADDLAKAVTKKDTKVLYVGFSQLYKSKHAAGAVYAGPGRSDEGLAELRKAVTGVPKSTEIVIYCGCCPWDHCPNLKPAYRVLRELGYTKIMITELPTNFLKDYVEKGFPVEGNTANTHGN